METAAQRHQDHLPIVIIHRFGLFQENIIADTSGIRIRRIIESIGRVRYNVPTGPHHKPVCSLARPAHFV
jgi:hypothetical protein